MQTCSAQAHGIDGHLFTVSPTPDPAGRIHVAGVRGNVARHTAATVTRALNRQAPADATEHVIGRIRRSLAGHRMTDICIGRMLVAAAKTLKPEAAE